MPSKYLVTFTRPYGCFNGNETAGLSEKQVRQLLARKPCPIKLHNPLPDQVDHAAVAEKRRQAQEVLKKRRRLQVAKVNEEKVRAAKARKREQDLERDSGE